MADNEPTWRDRLKSDRDSDANRIADTLQTTAGTVVVTVILAGIFIWAIVGSFIK